MEGEMLLIIFVIGSSDYAGPWFPKPIAFPDFSAS